MSYTNSPLINYIRISPNKTSPRKHIIDTITIHCMAGNLSIERCGEVFAPAKRQASSNYGIGSDGRIALYVEEKDRSWCTSSAANDHRAVTIEVANDGGAPDWHVSDSAMRSLINLVADICKRNNIRELKWQADKTLIGQVDRQNMTVHRWFAAKSCPGEYLYRSHGYIAQEVNKRLGAHSDPSGAPGTPPKPEPSPSPSSTPDPPPSPRPSSTPGLPSSPEPAPTTGLPSSPEPAPTAGLPSSPEPAQGYHYQGIDYSPVFDPAYYSDTYPDLKKAFGEDGRNLFNHFCTYGMREGRLACAAFDVNKYKECYEDLKNAFGDNLPLYYRHFITFGRDEGRKGI